MITANVSVIDFLAASGSSARATTMPACMMAPRRRCESGSTVDGATRPMSAATVSTALIVPKRIALIELVPEIPSQDVRAVEHDDALHLRVDALVQERVEAQLEDPHRVRLTRGCRCLEHLRRELVLDLLEGGLKQVGLAREVVIERSPADRGLAEDLLGGGGGESLLREEASGRRDETASGGLGAFRLGGHEGILTGSLQTDSWYVKYEA